MECFGCVVVDPEIAKLVLIAEEAGPGVARCWISILFFKFPPMSNLLFEQIQFVSW